MYILIFKNNQHRSATSRIQTNQSWFSRDYLLWGKSYKLQMYGKRLKDFPQKTSALFGLVSQNDPCSQHGFPCPKEHLRYRWHLRGWVKKTPSVGAISTSVEISCVCLWRLSFCFTMTMTTIEYSVWSLHQYNQFPLFSIVSGIVRVLKSYGVLMYFILLCNCFIFVAPFFVSSVILLLTCFPPFHTCWATRVDKWL